MWKRVPPCPGTKDVMADVGSSLPGRPVMPLSVAQTAVREAPFRCLRPTPRAADPPPPIPASPPRSSPVPPRLIFFLMLALSRAALSSRGHVAQAVPAIGLRGVARHFVHRAPL